jgi:hypothetical protein
MSRLNRILNNTEANQLYQTIINKIESDNFNPDNLIEIEDLISLLKG